MRSVKTRNPYFGVPTELASGLRGLVGNSLNPHQEGRITSTATNGNRNISTKQQNDSEAPTPSQSKLSYAEQREREKAIKRAEKKVTDAEMEISRYEAEIAEIEILIANGNVSNDIFAQHAEKNKQLENAMSIWELASIELDEINSKLNN